MVHTMDAKVFAGYRFRFRLASWMDVFGRYQGRKGYYPVHKRIAYITVESWHKVDQIPAMPRLISYK